MASAFPKKKVHRYGRGKFTAHPKYIQYMEMIVDHPVYEGMPNARSADGRINWQVSSGRSTSFYEHYIARRAWWERKADELGLPGSGNDRDRFSIAARLIHPTGYRTCRLCGEYRNIGYLYLNHHLARRIDRLAAVAVVTKGQAITDVLDAFPPSEDVGAAVRRELERLFPERSDVFKEFGIEAEAFEESSWRRTRWLSPGFMANPPDRLDGFHDYCVFCRAGNDPGRSPENLRSYLHDRRAFQWWAEGDWSLADTLYNSAGAGRCAYCGTAVDRVSPDHVGPLACGFKQLPLFVPSCMSCNSSKNRRMRLRDVRRLIDYENQTGDSAASWHVRSLWDASKHRVSNDPDANELSSQMRAMLDSYLRILSELTGAGEARFVASFLNPEAAYLTHEFVGLDRSALTFEAVRTEKRRSPLRHSLACRSVRIAFEELRTYAAKQPQMRKLSTQFADGGSAIVRDVLKLAAELPRSPLDVKWDEALSRDDRAEIEQALRTLLGERPSSTDARKDEALRAFLEERLSEMARLAVPA